jgi:hypothetical protein
LTTQALSNPNAKQEAAAALHHGGQGGGALSEPLLCLHVSHLLPRCLLLVIATGKLARGGIDAPELPTGSRPTAPQLLQSSTAPKPALAVKEALEAVLAHAKEGKPRKFVETVDMAIQLGVDPRKPNQSVRGVQALPNGTGKSVRVAVFAKGDVRRNVDSRSSQCGSSAHQPDNHKNTQTQDAEAAKAAGASIVGADDLVKAIQGGELNFDRCVATPEVMPLVSRVARVRMGMDGPCPQYTVC